MSAITATSADSNKESQHVLITPKEYEDRIVLRLALKYKDHLPSEAIERINEAIPSFMRIPEKIAGKPDIRKMFPADAPREGPIYTQGDAGVGKTEIPEGAARRFCDIAGLNFVKDPPEDYVPAENDFLYTVIDMSGKNNIADVAGAIGRVKLDDGKSVMESVISAARGIGIYSGAEVGISKPYANDVLSAIDISIAMKEDEAIAADTADAIAEAALRIAKDNGIMAEIGKKLQPGQLTARIEAKNGSKTYVVTVAEPKRKPVDASALLPSRQLARLGMAKYGLLMVDDLGNCPQHLRNIFLQIALNGVAEGICDIRHIDMAITANPPKTKHGLKNKNVISERSFPEITRSQSFELVSTPEDWLNWVARQRFYSDHGDCHFHSFISMNGHMQGVFQMHPDPAKYEEGAPIPVPRSITKAMNATMKWYTAAKSFSSDDYSVPASSIYREQIQNEVASCVGKEFASSYISHVVAMESDAIPMAKKCIETGKIDESKFVKSADPRNTRGLDFSFRFAYALADIAADTVSSALPSSRKNYLENMFKGMVVLPDSIMNASLTRFVGRLTMNKEMSTESLSSRTGRAINVDMAIAVAEAFSAQQDRFDNPRITEKNVREIVSGHKEMPVNKMSATKALKM